MTEHMASSKCTQTLALGRILPHGRGLTTRTTLMQPLRPENLCLGQRQSIAWLQTRKYGDNCYVWHQRAAREVAITTSSGEIRSCFGMTEPLVASSDPTQLKSTAKTNDGGWIINGRKWWTTGACDERCAVCLFVGNTATEGPVHRRHTFFLVPMEAPG